MAGQRSCPRCGTPYLLPPTGLPAGATTGGTAAAPAKRGAWSGAALVALASGALALIGWPVLGLPARALHEVIPAGNCSTLTPGTSAMTWCSAKVGFLTVLGPLLVVLSTVLLRAPLRRLTGNVSLRLPKQFRFLVGPTLATGLFTMAYAEVHRSTPDQTGFLPQRLFPIVVGLFVYALSHAGPALGRRLSGFFDRRDKIPMWLRLPVAIVPPLLVGYLMMRGAVVTDTAQKEQLTILMSLSTTFLALVPRSGDLGAISPRRSHHGQVPT